MQSRRAVRRGRRWTNLGALRLNAARIWAAETGDVIEIQPSDLLIPIRRADGSPVNDLRSPAHWKHLRRKSSPLESIDFETLARDELHHRFYGGPWIRGRVNFDALKALGVMPSDRVLDVGCGAGRLGIWLIPYLDAGRYFGIEHHLGSLVAFSAYEAALHELAPKAASLMWDADFAAEGFGVVFDVIVDCSSLSCLPEREDVVRALKRLRRCSGPQTRLISRRALKPSPGELETAGWRPGPIRRIQDVDWIVCTPAPAVA